MIKPVKNIKILSYFLKEDSVFPNSKYPLLIYKSAWELPKLFAASAIEKHLKENFWENSWRNGVYHYHHYHSTAHEVMAVYEGKARILFGGEKGIAINVKEGDIVLVPAGVAHKRLSASKDFKIVGAYPKGQDYDMNYCQPGERPKTDQRIKKVSLPKADPLYGKEGPLMKYWKKN
jgi:uncharacterized protein YjlB